MLNNLNRNPLTIKAEKFEIKILFHNSVSTKYGFKTTACLNKLNQATGRDEINQTRTTRIALPKLSMKLVILYATNVEPFKNYNQMKYNDKKRA